MENKCIWLLGLSGAGKTTLANSIASRLPSEKVKILDGDILRRGINSDLSFTATDRLENVRRTAEIAKLFIDEGYWVIVALITPFEAMRQENRQILQEKYIEVFVDTPISVCEQRDTKGLYAKVANNQLKNFTGKDSPFEPPITPHLTILTEAKTIEECSEQILSFVL